MTVCVGGGGGAHSRPRRASSPLPMGGWLAVVDCRPRGGWPRVDWPRGAGLERDSLKGSCSLAELRPNTDPTISGQTRLHVPSKVMRHPPGRRRWPGTRHLWSKHTCRLSRCLRLCPYCTDDCCVIAVRHRFEFDPISAWFLGGHPQTMGGTPPQE